MALSSCLFLFIVSHLLMFGFAMGRNYKPEAKCSESFQYGSLGEMSFPFFKSNECAGCGLCMVDCDAEPSPKIKLCPERHEYDGIELERIDTTTNTIHGRWLEKCSCLNFIDISLLNTSSISFTFFPHVITLVKCHNPCDPTLEDLFRGYHKFDQCEIQHGFHVYFGSPYDTSPLSALGTLPANCSVIQLPLAPPDQHLYGDLFSLLAGKFMIKWNVSAKYSDCHHRGGQCLTDWTTQSRCSPGIDGSPPTRNSPPPIAIDDSASKTHKLRLILGTVAFAGGVAILLMILVYNKRKYFSCNFKTDKCQNVEAFLNNYGLLAPRRYDYSHVKKMTSSFMIRLGQGGYGFVYKGKLHDGSLVAVKILDETKGNGEEFVNEVASISRTSHVNIVKLIGFCIERKKRALIYEFMPNGSLERFIYDKRLLIDHQLGWQTLHKIAIGIARGLEYLHCHCNTQILHFDIKPHNILLDVDFSPKISDFGLSKLCTRTKSNVSILGARGTIGYIAPEVVCRTFGRVSHKSDVYSYGMMILEMVGGRKNIDLEVDSTSEIYYPHWIYKQLELNQELGLDGILDEEDNKKARKMIIVSLWCIQTNPSIRPSMTKVVKMLEGNLESLQIPPKVFLYSPSRSPVESSIMQIM